MQYPIYIEAGNETQAYSIFVPDIDGCFSTADNESDILAMAREAILGHLECIDYIPQSSTFAMANASAPAGFYTLLVVIDLTEISDKKERVNVSFPRSVLREIYKRANRAKLDRSAFLAEKTEKVLS